MNYIYWNKIDVLINRYILLYYMLMFYMNLCYLVSNVVYGYYGNCNFNWNRNSATNAISIKPFLKLFSVTNSTSKLD